MLSSALLAIAACAATVLADPYTFTVASQSGMFNYNPEKRRANVNLTNFWHQDYTVVQAGEPDAHYGSPGKGDQIMWNTGATGDAAPSVKYSFTGAGIAFRGYWGAPRQAASSQAAVELVVDGQSTTFNGVDGPADTLVMLANATLENGNHDVELILRTGDVSILFIDVTLDFPDIPLKTIQNMETSISAQAEAGYEEYPTDLSPNIIFAVAKNETGASIVNPRITASPPWFVNRWINNLVLYPNIFINTGQARVSADLGKGNFFVRINCTIQNGRDKFALTLDPAPPNRPATVTGYSYAYPWNGNGTMFMAALDPEVSYTVTLQNIQTELIQNVDLHSIELWTGDKDPTNAVNPVVGGLSNSSSTAGSNSTTYNSGNNNGTGNSTGGTANNKGDVTSTNSNNDSNNRDGTSDKNTGSGSGEVAKQKSPAGAIAGGVIGGLIGGLLIALLTWFIVRKTQGKRWQTREDSFEIEDHTAHAAYQPQKSTDSLAKIAPYEPMDFNPQTYEPYRKQQERQNSGSSTSTFPAPPAPLVTAGSSRQPYGKPDMHPLKLAILNRSLSSSGPSGSSRMSSSLSSEFFATPENRTERSQSPALESSISPFSPTAESIQQETDGGAFVFPPRRPRHIIPPSYDPTWASGHGSTDHSDSRLSR